MFDPANILRLLSGGLAGLMQRKICLVEPILYSVRCPCSFQLSLMWHPQCLIQPIIGALIWGHPQQGDPGRHPYLIMEGNTLYVPVLRCWYLVRLTKMLWAAALLVWYCYRATLDHKYNLIDRSFLIMQWKGELNM